jgi:hypothetical protein
LSSHTFLLLISLKFVAADKAQEDGLKRWLDHLELANVELTNDSPEEITWAPVPFEF